MKHTKQEVIPIHPMNPHTPSGILFGYLEIENEYNENLMRFHKNTIHRDDYYMFLFLESAKASLIIDFEKIQLMGNSVLYIRPGQVHFLSLIRETKGWYLLMDSMLLDKDYRNTFEEGFLTQRPVSLEASVSTAIQETSRLLETTIQASQTAFNNKIILSLANVFIGMIAGQYAGRQEHLPYHKSRSEIIANQFRKLLSENFKTIKSPIEYARALNYSLSHLNESVKKNTGFPVSYWIHQQVVLEAKRLLYYTDMEVKEIAFSLGYEDEAYFSRLFSKVVGISPMAFRRKFHE